jgi:hypothetical protein
VVLGAQNHARRLKHNYIGTEHILLALLDVEEGITAETFLALNVRKEKAYALIVRIVGYGESTMEGQIPFTPRVKKVLELGLRETLKLGHDYVGPEHILLGLVRENEGVAARVLLDLGTTGDSIREEVLRGFETLHKPESAARRAQENAPDQDLVVDGTDDVADAEKKAVEERIEAVPTHPDHPATFDELGRERLAAVIAERIRRARGENPEMPVAGWIQRWQKVRDEKRAGREAKSFFVHIHAPWGAGKSSLLNFLATDLQNRPRLNAASQRRRIARTGTGRRKPERPNLAQWIVVEFSAWKHQRLVPPWWWLLSAVQRACTRELWRINRGRWLWFWVRDIAWRLWNARVIAIAGLLLIGLAAAAWQLSWFGLPDKKVTVVQAVVLTAVSVIGLITALIQIVRGFSRWLAVGSSEGAVRFLKRSHDPLKVYRRRFRWLVRSAGRPLTVFIDDLDRCRSEYVVELLEGIQTLFVNESVTYVVAADRTWLCESFACTYGDFKKTVGEPGRPLGYLFLEKTFQISLEIPPMSEEVQSHYWKTLMEGESNNGASGPPRRRSAELASEFSYASTQADVEREVRTLIDAGEDRDEVRSAAVRRMNAPELQDQYRAQLQEFAPLLEKNPRSMKRLMNGYGIERDRLLRDGYLLTPTERGQLALLTIFWLRWPELGERIRRFPEEAAYFFSTELEPNSNSSLMKLRNDPELRRVLSGSGVDANLDPESLARFPGRPPS